MPADIFEDFRRLRPKLPTTPAYVFVPVSPPNPDLLFVGQATRGMVYDDDCGYETAAARCVEELNYWTSNPPRAGFWRSIARISDQVRLVSVRKGGEPTIGWSNLCKVGAAEGNPNGAMIKAQADLCCVSLQQELRLAKAKLTVFLTSGFARDEILYPTLGEDGWRNNVAAEDRIAVKRHPEFGWLLWGYHPVGPHGRKHWRELEAFVAGFASARLAHVDAVL